MKSALSRDSGSGSGSGSLSPLCNGRRVKRNHLFHPTSYKVLCVNGSGSEPDETPGVYFSSRSGSEESRFIFRMYFSSVLIKRPLKAERSVASSFRLVPLSESHVGKQSNPNRTGSGPTDTNSPHLVSQRSFHQRRCNDQLRVRLTWRVNPTQEKESSRVGPSSTTQY